MFAVDIIRWLLDQLARPEPNHDALQTVSHPQWTLARRQLRLTQTELPSEYISI